MSMGIDNLVGMSCHVIFYIGFVSQCHKQLVSKGSVSMCIPIIVRVREIWEIVFFKLGFPFDGLVSSKNVLLDSSYRIETHIDVVLEVIEVHSSVFFELFIDEPPIFV